MHDMPTARFGVGVPNFDRALERMDVRSIARAIEDGGFDGAWVTDHVLLAERFESKYPYSEDGSFFLPPGGRWYESLVTMSFIAAATERIEVGVGVAVFPLREPRLFSQQVAALDQLSGGRVVLAAGAGWLAEEFEALEVPFAGRGARLDAMLELMRACWTGTPPAGRYGPFTLPEGILANPVPAQARLPILIGGHAERALRRAVTHGDGWYGAVGAGRAVDLDEIRRVRERLAELCDEHSRDPRSLVLAMRVAVPSRELGANAVAEQLASLVGEGVTSLTVDFGWRSLEDGRRGLEALADTVARVRAAAPPAAAPPVA